MKSIFEKNRHKNNEIRKAKHCHSLSWAQKSCAKIKHDCVQNTIAELARAFLQRVVGGKIRVTYEEKLQKFCFGNETHKVRF